MSARHNVIQSGKLVALAVGLLLPSVGAAESASKPAELRKEYGYAAAWRGHHTENRHIGLGGCTLIAPSWVITAAHVASKKANTPDKVNVEVKFGGESRYVDKAFCAKGGDLAIAHLIKPVTNIMPVALCEKKIEKGWGTFPMTWVSAGRGFKVVPDIKAAGRKGGDRIYIGKDERPGKAGDSGCAYVLDMPSGTNDILIGVLHGTGRAQQPAVFREWIEKTMAENSSEKATWKPRPEKTLLRENAAKNKADGPDLRK